MCGRYGLVASEEELLEAFDAPALTFEHHPRYNIAPGTSAPVVAEDRRGRRVGLLDWGFLPAWKPEPSGAFINARAESVATKTSFREAFRRRRCLVPASGFYEWRPEGGRKIPYWIRPAEGGVLSFAAVWESWAGSGEEPHHGFAILTTDASDDVRPIHDRMPVIIQPIDRDRWLERSVPVDQLDDLLRPSPAGSLVATRVGTRVNRADVEGPGLIEPVDED